MQFADDVELLGVTLDSTLSINKHVVDVTRSCHHHIRALRRIRPLLTLDVAKAMTVSIVGIKLDYCKSRPLLVFYTACRRLTLISYSVFKMS